MAQDIKDFIASAPLKAEIAAVYSFEQVAAALRHAARMGAERSGKIVLSP